MKRVLLINTIFCLSLLHTIDTLAFNTSGPIKKSESKKSAQYFNDLAEVDAASTVYLRRNYVYTFDEAISTKAKLEKQLAANPELLSIRWAILRYYISASNFVGGCDAKAIEQARFIYGNDNYIGCLAYEFVYSRLKKFDKAEFWYRKSILAAQMRDNEDFEWKEIVYNKSVQSSIKVVGAFNNNTPNELYENNDATYSRRVATKVKSNSYKIIVDDRTTIARQ
jgi:hypothetical protein